MTRSLVDLHSHVLPAVDDGARDLEEALEALEALVAAGVEKVVATPHFRASLFERGTRAATRLARFDEAHEALTVAARERGLRIELGRACEFKLDAPVVELSDPRLRLGGTRFALVEFASFQLPPFGGNQLAAVREAGWVPLLAHPERYLGIETALDQVGRWVAEGALLQVNARSLTGLYGAGPRRAALELLSRGWVCCLASDYHARGDPQWREVLELLARASGVGGAPGPEGGDPVDPAAVSWIRELVSGNPGRLLAGEEPVPVLPAKLDPRRKGRV